MQKNCKTFVLKTEEPCPNSGHAWFMCSFFARQQSTARTFRRTEGLLSYLTLIISLLSMSCTYMWCHGRSSPSSPPSLTTNTLFELSGAHH